MATDNIAYAHSPHNMVVRLLSSIKNDGYIANYVNSYWGTKMGANDVARIRRFAGGKEPKQIEAAAYTGRDDAPDIKRGSDRLLAALRKYHPERCPA